MIEVAVRPESAAQPTTRSAPWWWPLPVLAAIALILFVARVGAAPGVASPASATWWLITGIAHVPLVAIVAFLAAGLVERIGYLRHGHAPRQPGPLPARLPSVCVQLPMFNEHDVAPRVIEAACRLDWPLELLHVQVLDDSTDAATRALVDDICAAMRRRLGVDCTVLRRADRAGYKAGALEAGRRATAAELIAIFDADFVPPRDFLRRAVAHFYRADGRPDLDLALVQAQWGHLNHDESGLTRAQSLWVDDHHTLQMSWRAARFGFVNFTGTAGIWRSEAIERTGGWRAASLVEDCELSFRHLFCGYRTTFVKEIVAPAELPATYPAYKSQQRRWTLGWVQLQRLHLSTLLRHYPATRARRAHLLYHMCISWQWPLWLLWIVLLPFLINGGWWFGGIDPVAGLAVYLLPTTVWLLVATTLATIETRHTYVESSFGARLGRLAPYVVVNTGMLAHQAMAFLEGLTGPLHGEFERTPKRAGSTTAPSERSTVRRPYVLAEAVLAVQQLAWAATFVADGAIGPAAGAAFVGACVAYVAIRGCSVVTARARVPACRV